MENSRSVETGGTGLGLAIAKKVILLHHGKISVSSDFKGTVFSISLPIGDIGEDYSSLRNSKRKEKES